MGFEEPPEHGLEVRVFRRGPGDERGPLAGAKAKRCMEDLLQALPVDLQ
jgi:hypothetical protein